MKICAGVLAYNAEIIIEASLKSIENYVDHIFVINGSALGPSTDKTAKIAESVGKKVEVISGMFDNKLKQRQVYLDLMIKDDNNWCILHDSDEVWRKDFIEKLINYILEASLETKAFGYSPINFYKDYHHIISGGSWDKPR